MFGFENIATGGGAITPDLSATAESGSGNISNGTFNFGGYTPAANYTPLLIAAVILAVVLMMVTKSKRK